MTAPESLGVPAPPPREKTRRERRLLNVGAIVTEVVVLLALWLLGRTFGS